MLGRGLRAAMLVLAVLGCALAGGCGQSHASFHLDMIEQVKNKTTPEQQQQIADVLTAMFGTPDKPFVLPQTGLDIELLRTASGPVHRDAVAGPRGLYREHCVHCHGITGDGAGPTAAFENPYPRDYRRGWYKFKSTKRDDEPTTADLMRTLTDGLQGSYMPSFKLLPEIDRRALVEYVKYLSMRGEMELALLRYLKEADKPDLTDTASLLDMLASIAEPWQHPIPILVDDRPADLQFDKIADPVKRKLAEDESIAIGRQMFTHEKADSFDYPVFDAQGNPVKGADGKPQQQTIQFVGAACIKCHGPTALGDGTTTDYDDWTKQVWPSAATATATDDASLLYALGALPKRNIIPRNLRLGVYRGGRRPLDFYYRIHEGINAAPMPATDLLTDEEKKQRDAIKADAEKQAAAHPEFRITEDDSLATQKLKSHQKAEFIAKIVDPKIEKLQSRRMWYLVDYVRSLPYEPGGELGADAAVSNMDSPLEPRVR